MATFNTIYVWKGTSGGDWYDNVHNWTPGYPIASPPGYGDLTIFNDGSTETVAGNGAASEADVVLGTTLTIQDSLSLDGAVTGVGLMVDSGGKVIVGSGATKPGVPSAGGVSVDVIGFNGAGALDVGTGGGLDDTGMVLGDRSTGSGTLTVEGTVIVAPANAPNGLLIVGNAGSGLVTVQNGGALSAVTGTVLGLQSGSSGTATLTGAGSTWLAGALTVGQAGTGSITVRNGGVLTTTNASIIGFDDAGTGAHGTGGVTIEAGGDLTALTSLGIGSHGTFVVNDGTVAAGAIAVSGGTVAVSNAGSVTTQALTMSGGTIDVSNGGILVDSPTAIAGTAGTVLVGAGANVNALGTIIGRIQLNGALLATGSGPGLLRINGDITGGGTLAPLMTLDLNGDLGANVSIVFGASAPLQPGVLILDDARDEFGTISGFDQGNTIYIPSGHFTDTLFAIGDGTNPGTLTLSGGGEIPLTLAVAGDYGATDFIASSDTIGTTVTLMPCFTAGTGIATEAGPVTVEALREGDRVLTFNGGVRPVRWIGRRAIDLTRHPDRCLIEPVRIRKDAIAGGQPYRDVLVSPDHALFMNGVLVPARLLVNGGSITRETAARRVMYYHVELDAHDIVFADGMPAESYLETGNRAMFENSLGTVRLHPNFGEGQTAREAGSCVPFAARPEQVRPVWERLAFRAKQLGYDLSTFAGTTEANPRLLANSRALRPICAAAGVYSFMLPSGSDELRLVSRAARPSDARPWIEDQRLLGVSVRRIRLHDRAEVTDLALDGPAPGRGWWDVERETFGMSRWTNGDAVLHLPASHGSPRLLELTMGGGMTYPVAASAVEWAEAAAA